MHRVIFDEEENKYQLNKLMNEDEEIRNLVTKINKFVVSSSMSYLDAKRALDYANQALMKKALMQTFSSENESNYMDLTKNEVISEIEKRLKSK